MSIPLLKIAIFRKPIIKGKMDVRFPANVVTANFLTVTRSNGTYTFGVDYTLLASTPISDPTKAFVAVQDTTDGSYKSVSMKALNPTVSNSPAYTFIGNATGSPALPTNIDITALAAKASPVSADIVLIQDSAAGNAFKKTTVGGLLSGGAVASYNGLTGAVVAASADKRYFVSTAGNDSNNGLSPESAKLTLQAAVNAASPNGVVYAGAGTFTQTANLLMQPGVRIVGVKGATTITQGSAANLTRMVDFATNSANNAALYNVIIDGNRANNTEGSGIVCYVGTANDVGLEGNSFINGPGNGVLISTGLRPIIRNNYFSNINLYAVGIDTGVPNTTTAGRIVDNTFDAPLGASVVALTYSSENVISRNRINGSQIGNVAAPLRVSTSGTTVTWVSGPTFANVMPGMFLIMNTGGEYAVTAKASSTSLTVGSTPGTTTNVAALIGTGDMIAMNSSSDNLVSDNRASGGATGAIGVSNVAMGADARRNVITNNDISFTGEPGIFLSNSAGAAIVGDTRITNNRIRNAAQTSTAGPAGAYKAGISVIGAAQNTFIDGNHVIDTQGTTTYWLGLSSVNAGQVFVGRNMSTGPTNNQEILAGIASVTLSANWGTGAAVSSIVSYGSSFSMTITAGTGTGVNPTITVSASATGLSPVVSAKAFANATGGELPIIGDQNVASGSKVFTVIGTPVASNGYTFYVSGN